MLINSFLCLSSQADFNFYSLSGQFESGHSIPLRQYWKQDFRLTLYHAFEQADQRSHPKDQMT